MEARNFRFLFENTSDGIVHSGCILDTIEDMCTNFTYMCGVQGKKENVNRKERVLGIEKINDTCHILILASFSLPHIRKMLKILENKIVETVVLPYVAPIQRLMFLQRIIDESRINHDLLIFMEQPYLYLKNAGVRNIYFLYGNGDDITMDINQLDSGHYFELADQEDITLVKELEGEYIPIVKAGYIIENNWIFYFGSYGKDISNFNQFSRQYFGGKKTPIFRHKGERFNLEMHQILHEYTKQFGKNIAATVVMYQGPLDTKCQETDSVMTGKVFTKNQGCVPEISEDGRNCFWKCSYQEDHTVYRRHKNSKEEDGCVGMLLLGNIDMNKWLPEIRRRYGCVIHQVCGVTIPRGGKREYWNRQCLSLLYGENTKYWVCGLDWETSPTVISDIIVSNPKNQVVTISEEFGYCFSGYLTPFVENE